MAKSKKEVEDNNSDQVNNDLNTKGSSEAQKGAERNRQEQLKKSREEKEQ